MTMTAKQIRAVRAKAGINTEAFGKLLGISPRTVEDYEQGRRRVPPTVEVRLTGVCPVCKSKARGMRCL
jgi:DNA-binding transcriptional regulator YiaG